MERTDVAEASTGIDTVKDLAGRIVRVPGDFAMHSSPYTEVYVGHLSGEDGNRIMVAIKIVGTGTKVAEFGHYHKVLNRELRKWQTFKHPNILPFLGIASDIQKNGFPALISPYCNNSTVVSYLERYPETNRTFMIMNVIEGLIYLHGIDVVHGSLKPNNILIDDHGIPVLCDIGCSRIRGQSEYTTNSIAGSIYQARELLGADDESDIQATTGSDIYSFGMTCYEIWSGRPPYATVTSNKVALLMEIIYRHKLPDYPDPAPLGTQNIWPILNGCWALDPSLRPTSSELRKLLQASLEGVSPSISATTTTQQKIIEEDGRAIPRPTLADPVSLETSEEHTAPLPLPVPVPPPQLSLLKSFIRIFKPGR